MWSNLTWRITSEISSFDHVLLLFSWLECYFFLNEWKTFWNYFALFIKMQLSCFLALCNVVYCYCFMSLIEKCVILRPCLKSNISFMFLVWAWCNVQSKYMLYYRLVCILVFFSSSSAAWHLLACRRLILSK